METKTCIKLTQSCNGNSSSNGAQVSYLRETGCPVKKKCQIGVDGEFFIGMKNSTEGGIDTTSDGQIKFEDISIDKVRQDSSLFPCAMVFYNLPKKDLTMQVSGPNIGV